MKTKRLCRSFALVIGLSGCGDKPHPAPVADYLSSCDMADAGCKPASEKRTTIPYECMTDEQAADFNNPLVSTIQAFEDDTFFPDRTRAISGGASLETLGQLPYTYACLDTQAGDLFELLGGNSTSETGGLRIDPVDNKAFHSTMIQKVRRANLEIPAIPVVAKEEWNKMFSTLDIAPKRNKGQVLVEVAFVPAAGARYRVPNIELRCEAAEAIAYRVDGKWTTDATQTSGDGLALLINVNSADELGLLVDWHYLNHAFDNPTAEVGPERVYAISGGITYLAFQPPTVN